MQEDLEDLLRGYYSKATLWLPPSPSFRQFRLFLGSDGKERVVKVRDRIRSQDILRRWLVRFAPLHVYYTTSKWLDSQNLGPKELGRKSAGYQFSYNVFLSQELYFDVDIPGSLQEAKKWTTQLKEALEKEYGFKEILTVYSGNKGFHLHVYDFNLEDWVKEVPADPVHREVETQEAKGQIVNRLMAKGLVFDADITMDTRRIIRLPGSVHGKTLNICQLVPDIDSFQPQRLEEDEKLARQTWFQMA